MATEKIVNYTEAQVAELKAAYLAEPTKATVAVFAEKFGKTVASIVAKLAREGVYKSEAKASTGKAVTKAELVTQIAKLVGASTKDLESLEKATAPALKAVLAALTPAVGDVTEGEA